MKQSRRRTVITQTQMSVLTGDSQPRNPAEVPKQIEVPMETLEEDSYASLAKQETNKSRVPRSSYEEKTASSKPFGGDVLQALSRNGNDEQSTAISKPKVDEVSRVSSRKTTSRKAASSARSPIRRDPSGFIPSSTAGNSKQSKILTNRSSRGAPPRATTQHEQDSIAEETFETYNKSKNRQGYSGNLQAGNVSKASSSQWSTATGEDKSKPSYRSGGPSIEQREPQSTYLPMKMLADTQTDVFAMEQRVRREGPFQSSKPGQPFQPEFDEWHHLLLAELQTDESPAVEEALHKLGALIKDKGNAELTYGLGGHVALSMVMRRFSQDPEIQRWGCFCFSQLFRTKPIPALAIVKSGGIEALVNAIQLLPESYSIQANALFALQTLLMDLEKQSSPEESDKTCYRFLNDFDGLQLIVQAMNRFPDKPALQSSGAELCKLLVDKCKDRAMKAATGEVVKTGEKQQQQQQHSTAMEKNARFFGSTNSGSNTSFRKKLETSYRQLQKSVQHRSPSITQEPLTPPSSQRLPAHDINRPEGASPEWTR